VTVELVRRCLDGLEGVDGVIAAVPVTDTVKEVEDGEVIRTPDRGRLWAAQTPQVFRADVLRRASGADATDDASLVEAVGGRIRVVEGMPENFKVTSPLDVRVAEMLLC
jgi:2-C-methyl-D-erythritol 4-phosphate cytidylyltransferase